jgi:hypothetical protein
MPSLHEPAGQSGFSGLAAARQLRRDRQIGNRAAEPRRGRWLNDLVDLDIGLPCRIMRELYRLMKSQRFHRYLFLFVVCRRIPLLYTEDFTTPLCRTLQALMGHKRKETTLKYIHLARTNLRKEMVETAL